MLELSAKWVPFFRNAGETGMGYVICSVKLIDGKQFDRVVIVGGIISSVDGSPEIPFTETDIAEFIVTHDKSAMRR